MKNFILKISLLILLIIAPICAVYSQTQPSPIVGKNETVSFLIRQNENARELISKQEKRISDLESELSAERENTASISKSYDAAKSEIISLQKSNEALTRAVSINEATIELLQKDNTEQREKVKKANKARWKAYAIAAAAVAAKLLIP